MKLTDSKIKSIKAPVKRDYVWEGGTGFGIRLEPSGTKSFVLWYRFNGKPEGVTLGRYPKISLSNARYEAAKIKDKISRGIDPKVQINADKIADRGAYTVKDLVHEYLDKWAKQRKKTWLEDKRCLEKEVVPAIGRKKSKDVRRRDIILILDQIVKRGSPGMANRTLNVITKMFNFAVSRDILDTSPCVAINMPAKKNQRDRVLNEIEIKGFWQGLDDAPISDVIRIILKLVLVTGQRRGEVAGAEWNEFNLSEKWWTIPAEKSKNGLAHRVPLNRMALKILKEVKEMSGDSIYLFPSIRKSGSIDPRAVTRALRKAQNHFGMNEEFRPHDLRRTAATQMTSNGVKRDDVAKILNHVDSGVTSIYDRHSYDDEKRKALEKWGRILEKILTGNPTKVIQLRS